MNNFALLVLISLICARLSNFNLLNWTTMPGALELISGLSGNASNQWRMIVGCSGNRATMLLHTKFVFCIIAIITTVRLNIKLSTYRLFELFTLLAES